MRPAGGGSSFVSGMEGCIAINPPPNIDGNPRTKDDGSSDYSTDKTALNYYHSLFQCNPTSWNDHDEIKFSSASTIAGNASMVNPDGSISTGYGSNNGYARITLIP